MGTTNQDFLIDPSMSREYKSWPALGDMDYAVHTIFVSMPRVTSCKVLPPRTASECKKPVCLRAVVGVPKRRPPHRCFQDAGVIGMRSQYGVVAQMCRALPVRMATKTHLGSKSKVSYCFR